MDCITSTVFQDQRQEQRRKKQAIICRFLTVRKLFNWFVRRILMRRIPLPVCVINIIMEYSDSRIRNDLEYMMFFN